MKVRVIGVCFFFCIINSVFAQLLNDSIPTNRRLENTEDQIDQSEPVNFKKSTKEISYQKIEALTLRICSKVEVLRSNNKVIETVENLFLQYLSITKDTPDYKEQIFEFWNNYSSCFICSRSNKNHPVPQHFMKRIIETNSHQKIFDHFILSLGLDLEDAENEGDLIDLNAVEVNAKGEKETVVDYIQSIIDNPDNRGLYDFEELERLKQTLIDFGAKRAIELDREPIDCETYLFN